MSKPIINSLIYRKPIKYGYNYYYINFFTEKIIALDNAVAEYILKDDEVTLANIEILAGNTLKITPRFTYALVDYDNPIAAHTLSLDQLIIASYEASTVFLRGDTTPVKKELDVDTSKPI